jgi:hypothetical protein
VFAAAVLVLEHERSLGVSRDQIKLDLRRDHCSQSKVTDGPDEPGRFHSFTRDIEAEDRAGDAAPFVVEREQFLARDQLASRHATRIGDQQLDGFNVGIGIEKLAGFVAGRCTK